MTDDMPLYLIDQFRRIQVGIAAIMDSPQYIQLQSRLQQFYLFYGKCFGIQSECARFEGKLMFFLTCLLGFEIIDDAFLLKGKIMGNRHFFI